MRIALCVFFCFSFVACTAPNDHAIDPTPDGAVAHGPGPVDDGGVDLSSADEGSPTFDLAVVDQSSDSATTSCSCGAAKICVGGACVSACQVGTTVYALGAVSPTTPCQSCQPASATSAFTPVANGTSCGTDQTCEAGACVLVGVCEIGAVRYRDGDINPSNPCQACVSGTSTAQWTALSEGATCSGNKICSAGSCVPLTGACSIDGMSIAAGSINPGNLCQSCQPARATGAWSNLSEGTSCSSYSNVCISGNCTTGCHIGNKWYTDGYINPQNACQACSYSSTTNWSSLNGASCGTGKVCEDSGCWTSNACTVNGAVYAEGAQNPQNPCEVCDPTQSLHTFVNRPDGTICGAGLCNTGNCYDGCIIDNVKQPIGKIDPSDPCRSCQPNVFYDRYTLRDYGDSCGDNLFCTWSGECRSGCFVDDLLWDPGEVLGGCRVCDPAKSTSSLSPLPNGTVCYGSGTCNTGECR